MTAENFKNSQLLSDRAERQQIETEAGRACALVNEIIDARAGGDFDSLRGNSDDDLEYALQEAAEAVELARKALKGGEHRG